MAIPSGTCSVVALLTLSLSASAMGQATFNQVALTGDPTGAADGAEFDAFSFAPAFNLSGDVAFVAELRTGMGGAPVTGANRLGLFGPTAGAGSTLGVVARENDLADPVDGAEFDSFMGAVTLNDSGQVAFSANLRTGPGGSPVNDDNNRALFGPTFGVGSPLGVVAREDRPAGTPDNAVFDFVSGPSLNNAGDVAFAANLRTGPGGQVVSSNRDEAIFGPVAGPGSALGVVVREDDPAGTADGAEFQTFYFGAPALNDAGDLAFRAELRTGGPGGSPVTDNNAEAVFGPVGGAGSPLGVIVREDDPAPGADGAEFNFFASTEPTVSASGDVAFTGFLRTGGLGGTPVTGDNGRAVFGPVSGAGSALGSLVRVDDPAGTEDDAEFAISLGSPAINASGDFAFEAFLRTGPGGAEVTPDNDQALFTLIDGELQLLVREGDLFEVEVDGFLEQRTIDEIAFSPRNGFNDAGALAFRLGFTDGTGGIFTTAVPEPGTLGLVGVACFALAGLSRRARCAVERSC